MKYRITRHLYAALIMIILVTATTVRLLRHEGNIEIKDAKGKKRAVLENVRFNSGETLSTGNKSSASIGLDEEKVVTMDEKSSVEFNKKSKKIELNVKSGQVLLDVKKKLNADEQLEVKTSTMSIGIRGTIVCIQAPEVIKQGSSGSNQNTSGLTRLAPPMYRPNLPQPRPNQAQIRQSLFQIRPNQAQVRPNLPQLRSHQHPIRLHPAPTGPYLPPLRTFRLPHSIRPPT